MLKASYVFLVLGVVFTTLAHGYALILFALGLFTGIYSWFKSKPDDQTKMAIKILPIVLNALFFIFILFLIIMVFMNGLFYY